MYRDCGDNDNRKMCNSSAKEKHNKELSKGAKLSNENQKNAAIQKEHQRHEQYSAGKNSNSPIKNVESE